MFQASHFNRGCGVSSTHLLEKHKLTGCKTYCTDRKRFVFARPKSYFGHQYCTSKYVGLDSSFHAKLTGLAHYLISSYLCEVIASVCPQVTDVCLSGPSGLSLR